MNLDTSKTLGGVGAILLFIGAIPLVQYVWVLGLVGGFLILAALYGLDTFYGSKGIFINALYGVITGIIGIIVTIGVAVVALLANLSNIKDFMYILFPTWNGDWASLSELTPTTANINPSDIIPVIAGVIVAIIIVAAVAWIFAIVATFFVRRSLKQVSEKANVGLFGTAGLFLFIGAILIIAFGFGLLLMWIAALLLAIAFFTIKPPMQQMNSTLPPPT
jgi:uncharacterized membrane protein